MRKGKQYILEELHDVYSLMDRLCETTLLLEAMSLDDIYTKYYSDIDREVFDKIASADPTGKPDKKGKYTEWLLNLYKADKLKFEDLYKATEYLTAFHKFKNRIEQKDIRAYKSLPELYDVVKEYIDNPDQATSKSDERRKVKNDEAEKVYEDSEWLVIVPHTKRAAIEYGKGTQWCTAATGSYNYFDDYNKDGPLYININKRTGKKFQFHFESHQFMDENDNPTMNYRIGLSDGLKDFYLKNYGVKSIKLFDNDPEEYINYCKKNGIDYIKQFIEDGVFGHYYAGKIKGHFDIPNSVTNIGDKAFSGCTGLTSVTIPNSVTTIGDSAFSWCSGLTSVTIPNSVTNIGDKAFDSCRGLTSVDIPNSVTELGYAVFGSCHNLTSVTLPDSITVIGDNCFYNCKLSSVNIPNSVTKIGHAAFSWCRNLITITLPDSITAISSSMFSFCSGLTSIDIPKSVKVIGIDAFENCTGLTSVTIPDSVINIANSAFSGCTNLSKVIIGNSVTTIGGGAFGGCIALTSVILPDSVKEVQYSAFHGCSNLENIIIGKSVTTIDSEAFSDCTNLRSVTVKGSETEFSNDAFEGCEKVTIYVNSIKQHQLIKRCGINCRVQINIDENSYRGIMMEALDQLLLEAMSLDDIYQKYYSDISREDFDTIVATDPTSKPNKKGKYTEWLLNLYKAGKLKSEDLYKATEYLEAFDKFKNRIEQKDIRSYKSLSELYVVVQDFIDNPDQATSKSDEIRRIKSDAEKVYEDNEWLVIVPHTKEAAIEYGKGTQWCTAATSSYNAFDYYNKQGKLYININKRTGDKFQFHFESRQFMNVNDHPVTNRDVRLSDGLKYEYIKNYTINAMNFFRYNLSELKEYCKTHGIEFSIKNVIEGGSDTSVFTDVKGDFEIPEGTNKIGKNIFRNCSNITSITIPDSVTEIGDFAFEECDSLRSITIPDSVTSIGYGAFSYCKGLQTVILPDSLTKIGGSAFNGCRSLRDIKIPGSIDIIENGTFGYCNLGGDLVIPDSVTSIGNNKSMIGGPFKHCQRLTSVYIPDSVTNIGWEAFYGCVNLNSVRIGNSVKQIGASAFALCRLLRSIVIPDSVETIGEYAFNKCSGLKSVKIGNSVKEILDMAFQDCTGLRSIVIPDSVEKITMLAFNGCYNLKIYVSNESQYKMLSVGHHKNVFMLGDKTTQTENVYHGIMMEALDQLLLEAMDLDQIHKNHYPGMSDEDFWAIVNADPTYDNSQPQKKGNYTQWLLNLRKANKLDMNELPNAKKYLETYDNFKNRIGALNFNNKFTVSDLGEKVQYFIDNPDEATSKSDELRRIKAEGAKTVYEDNEWEVKQIFTKEAAIEYGKNTQWCTSATESKNYFDDYVRSYGRGCLYVNINKQTGEKYQFCFESKDGLGEFNNAENKKVYFGKDLTLSDGLIRFYYSEKGWSAAFFCADRQQFYDVFGDRSQDVIRALFNRGGIKNVNFLFEGDFVIPDGVKIIGEETFEGCVNLTSVTIPDSVAYICLCAFSGCSGLTEVTIPDSVIHISSCAFYHCKGLTSVTIGNSVETIGYGAFSGCSRLTSVTIGNSVRTIEDGAFDGCNDLTIYVSNQEQYELLKNEGYDKVQMIQDRPIQTESIYHGIMMEALEELLLEAMSLDDIYQKYYSNIERGTFDKIASADPTGKPNKRGKYTEWLLNLYKAGNLKMEDLYKATEYLEAFHKFKNRIEKKDIGQYQSLPELYDAVKKYLDNPDQSTSKSDEVRKIKEGAEKLYEDNKWLIIVPHTMDAAIYYGKGTQWCTAATSSSNYFDTYVDRYGDSCLFINIDKENNRKYQFCFDSEEFMDERDHSILSKEQSIAETIGFDDKVLDFYSGVLCFSDWAYLKFPWGGVETYYFDDKTYISVGNRLYLDRGGSDIVYLVKLPYDYSFYDKTYHGICVQDFDGNCVDIFDVDTNHLIFDHLKEDPLLMHEQSAIEFDDLDGYYVNCILTGMSKIREIITVQLYKIDDDEHLAHVYYDLRKKEVVSPIIDREQYNAWHSSISPVYWLEDSNDDIVGASERNIIIFKHYDYRHDKHPIKVLDCSTGKTLNDTFFNTTRGYGYEIIRLPIITDDNKCYDLCFPAFLDKNNRGIIISNDMTPIPFNGYSDIDSMIKAHPLDPEHQKLIKKRIRNIRR